MMKPTLLLAAAALLLGGCGYKGDLYLPKEGDDARFGVIQTGLELPQKEPAAPVKQQP
ncbi:lipoprotein [Neisseria dentiae]|uniref:LPS translocon maturation chaperone LptM n=1 Tax=Neisseria dentiae TaxID=194197 RepID=UPI00211CB09D|nr:lipoprotein [Neisseria dentiae]MCQ9327315.1 lipoprotein [Neisseria dentiae]